MLASRSDTEGRCSGASPAPRRAGRVRSQPRHSWGAAAPPVSSEELAPLRVRADGCRSKLPVRQLCAGLSASALPLACPRRVRPASPPMGTRPARAGALVLPWGCADGRRPTTPLTHLRSALNAFATSQLPSRFGHRSTVIGCCSRASPAGAASGPAPPSRRSTGLPRPNHFPLRVGEGGREEESRSRSGIRQRFDLDGSTGLELDVEGEAPEKIGAHEGRRGLRDDNLTGVLFEDRIAEIRGN